MGYLEKHLRYFYYADILGVKRAPDGTTQVNLNPRRLHNRENLEASGAYVDEAGTGTKEWVKMRLENKLAEASIIFDIEPNDDNHDYDDKVINAKHNDYNEFVDEDDEFEKEDYDEDYDPSYQPKKN